MGGGRGGAGQPLREKQSRPLAPPHQTAAGPEFRLITVDHVLVGSTGSPRCGMPITTLSTPMSAAKSISAFMPGISDSQPSRPNLRRAQRRRRADVEW